MLGVPSLDPNWFPELPSSVAGTNIFGNQKTTNRTLTTLSPGAGIGVLIVVGASNGGNIAPTLYVPTNSTIFNFNPYDGAIYTVNTNSPLLGCGIFDPPPSPLGLGNVSVDMADNWITGANFIKVLLVNICVPSSKGSDWATGGLCNLRYQATIIRLGKLGFTPTAHLVMMGENDTGVSQASFQASLGSLFATAVASGIGSVPWFVPQESYNAGSTSSNIRAAQAAVINVAGTPPIYACTDLDTLTGANRNSDNLHWSDTGRANASSNIRSGMHSNFGAPF